MATARLFYAAWFSASAAQFATYAGIVAGLAKFDREKMSFTAQADLRVSLKVKDMFFDRGQVKAFIGAKTAAVLNRFGARIQKRAQHSMKAKGRARKPPKNLTGKAYANWLKEAQHTPPSTPPNPPHVHTDNSNASLRKILYSLKPDGMTVIAGPVLLNGSKNTNPTVPELNEFGGTARRRQKRVGNEWVPMGRRARPGQPTRTVNANYPARPFMGPALQKEIPKLPQLFKTTTVQFAGKKTR